MRLPRARRSTVGAAVVFLVAGALYVAFEPEERTSADTSPIPVFVVTTTSAPPTSDGQTSTVPSPTSGVDPGAGAPSTTTFPEDTSSATESSVGGNTTTTSASPTPGPTAEGSGATTTTSTTTTGEPTTTSAP